MSPITRITPMLSWSAIIPIEEISDHAAKRENATPPEWHKHVPQEMKFIPDLILDIRSAAVSVHTQCSRLIEVIANALESPDLAVNVADAISQTKDCVDWLEQAFIPVWQDWVTALPSTTDCMIVQIINMGKAVLSETDGMLINSHESGIVRPLSEVLRSGPKRSAWLTKMRMLLLDRQKVEIGVTIEGVKANAFCAEQREKAARNAMSTKPNLRSGGSAAPQGVDLRDKTSEIRDLDGPFGDFQLKLGSDVIQLNKKSKQRWFLLQQFWNIKVGDGIHIDNLVGTGMPWEAYPDESNITSAINRFKNHMPPQLSWYLKKDGRVIRKMSKPRKSPRIT